MALTCFCTARCETKNIGLEKLSGILYDESERVFYVSTLSCKRAVLPEFENLGGRGVGSGLDPGYRRTGQRN